MEINKESKMHINDKIYRSLKAKLIAAKGRYKRTCSFVRELKFDFINSYYTDEQDDNTIQFTMWMNRNNYNEIHLCSNSYDGEIVSEMETLITREEASHIINRDVDWLSKCDKELVRQLALQMKINNYYPFGIKEYFQERYVDITDKEKIIFNSMEILIKNDIKDFFNQSLSPLNTIDYHKVSVVYRQQLKMPLMINA